MVDEADNLVLRALRHNDQKLDGLRDDNREINTRLAFWSSNTPYS